MLRQAWDYQDRCIMVLDDGLVTLVVIGGIEAEIIEI